MDMQVYICPFTGQVVSISEGVSYKRVSREPNIYAVWEVYVAATGWPGILYFMTGETDTENLEQAAEILKKNRKIVKVEDYYFVWLPTVPELKRPNEIDLVLAGKNWKSFYAYWADQLSLFLEKLYEVIKGKS